MSESETQDRLTEDGRWHLQPGAVMKAAGFPTCSRCGERSEDREANFCGSCGHRLRENCAACCLPLLERTRDATPVRIMGGYPQEKSIETLPRPWGVDYGTEKEPHILAADGAEVLATDGTVHDFEFTVSLLEALCRTVNSAPGDVSLGYILARLKAGNALCGPEE